MENEEQKFSVFLIEELHEKIDKLDEKIDKNHAKIMEGFKCIEKAFQLMAHSLMALGVDLGEATGTISTDPWSFD
jgi:hypothetical protein